MLSHALFLPALFSTLSQSSHSYDPELYPSLQSSKIYPNNLRSAQQSISVSNMWIKFDFFKQIIKKIYIVAWLKPMHFRKPLVGVCFDCINPK